MAAITLNAADFGYVMNYTSGTSNPMNSGSDLYTGPNTIGWIKFTSSINTLLGTSVSSWKNLYFKTLNLWLKNSTLTMPTPYSFNIGVRSVPYDSSTNGMTRANKVALIEGTQACTPSSTATTAEDKFNIASVFNNLNSTSFTPSTSTWYLYIYHSGSTEYRFNANQGYQQILQLPNGTADWAYRTNMSYWNGSKWVIVEPRRWDGSAWVQCEALYWNGSKWVNC